MDRINIFVWGLAFTTAKQLFQYIQLPLSVGLLAVPVMAAFELTSNQASVQFSQYTLLILCFFALATTCVQALTQKLKYLDMASYYNELSDWQNKGYSVPDATSANKMWNPTTLDELAYETGAFISLGCALVLIFTLICLVWQSINSSIFIGGPASPQEIFLYCLDIVAKGFLLDSMEHWGVSLTSARVNLRESIFAVFTFAFRTFFSIYIITRVYQILKFHARLSTE